MLNNKSKAGSLVSKSQGHKKVFATLKNNLVKSNEAMLTEDGNLGDKIKTMQSQQAELKAEVIANENVVSNINNILGIDSPEA